jgi:hypothetical protein
MISYAKATPSGSFLEPFFGGFFVGKDLEMDRRRIRLISPCARPRALWRAERLPQPSRGSSEAMHHNTCFEGLAPEC